MSRTFSSSRSLFASPMDGGGGANPVKSVAARKATASGILPELRLSEDMRVRPLKKGPEKPEANKIRVDPDQRSETDEIQKRAEYSLRRATSQPDQGHGTKGCDAGVADAEGLGPETARKETARVPPLSRSKGGASIGTTIEAKANQPLPLKKSGGGDGNEPPQTFHKRTPPEDFQRTLQVSLRAILRNLAFVLVLTCATNILILAIPIYLFQISDRVLTSRSLDTLIMLTAIVAGAVIFQSAFDAVRRFMLMRTAVEVNARLGAPVLSAAAHASLHGTGREYQTLGDLQQVRGFLVSGTLISFLDVPFAPLFILMIFLVHPQLGMIVIVTALLLMVIAIINQRMTAGPFAEANRAQSMANQHLDSMSRNSQIINALAMIPEAVRIWGRDTAQSLTWQVRAQDRNVIFAAISRAVRLLTQIAILGWGAFLALQGEITGGMVIAASIIAGRAFAPIEGSIEGWNGFLLTRGAYGRIKNLLSNSALQFEKLRLPRPEGRLDVERLLFVPGGTKRVVLNGISFALNPGETLAIIGNSGAGKTTLGKTLVGSILPTSGSVRLDLMDIRNWDPRQFGESIGYLPQDVQLFPGTIKDNIGRMREDATDEQIHDAAVLADVHNMIATLPQGYETVVAADGSPLSGGQKQRIALARAFFGNPRLVVLDEPNSNLDVAGDQALARAIAQAKENKITVVVITQKPTLLNVVDKIMLLTDGRVALFGQREQVLQQLNGPRKQTGIEGQQKGDA
ncbi:MULTISPECIES: type I secretion system permease/ATPase [unclassified Ruegeria]|uniref:type I secretion system permease/ATPase n=1 Tax=unclassified Ruegeria TaxID=2625375 RepID=UPI001AD97FE4|nr:MULTISPECIES: type I secretion system permease/ATPase [unclassified Ruegeria]MBO9410163.1 type I secretion system permease/ATPase [Ruegeria sp. R8_1]MBO9414618.1 type I secretion system permease/ATPase [Ruegeria sp. R8_2]